MKAAARAEDEWLNLYYISVFGVELKKQSCISEQTLGCDSQRDEKMVQRHCSRIHKDGTQFFPASCQVRRDLEARGAVGGEEMDTGREGLFFAQEAPGVLQRGGVGSKDEVNLISTRNTSAFPSF